MLAITTAYGDFDWLGRQKNKAKQSQSPAYGRKSEDQQLRLCSRTHVAPCWPGNKLNGYQMTDAGRFGRIRFEKTKPIQSQFRDNYRIWIWPGHLRISRIFFGIRQLFSLRRRAGIVRICENFCKQLECD